MKPREFWLAHYQTTKRQDRWHGFNTDDIEGYGPLVHVREVKPELDAAYAECEMALKKSMDSCDCEKNKDHNYTCSIVIANEALAALKKARE